MAQVRVQQGLTVGATVGVVGLVVAGCLVGSGGGSHARADTPATTSSAQNLVTVDGTGKAAGTPDTMVTTIGVNVRGTNPSAALAGANQTMATVQRTFLKHGVATKDLKTTGLSVNPLYVYGKGTPSVHGYQASEQLEVTLRNLGSAGSTISAVMTAGGKSVTVDGISLDLEGDSALVKDARANAYADAKAKAEQYAALAGRTLGPVLSVSEHVNQPSSYQYDGASSAAAAPYGSVPVQAGSQDVSVNVTVAWTLN